MAALLPRVFSPVGHLTPLATVSFRVNGSMEPCQYRSPALRLLFVGGGWQASLPRGSSDDRLLLHMYPIRGCKDSRSFRPHKVVWLVPLQHLRQLRTLRTTWIVHVVRNLLRALDCKFIEPINELGIAANAWRPGVSSFLSRGRTADLSPRNPRASHFMRNQ